MKKRAYKTQIEDLIASELKDHFAELPIEGVGLVILPEKDWNVVVISNGQPMTGHELAVATQIAQRLQKEYVLAD